MDDGEQTTRCVAATLLQEKPESGPGPLDQRGRNIDTSPNQCGDRMAVHRWLRDRRAATSPPQFDRDLRVELIPHVRNETGLVLEFERLKEEHEVLGQAFRFLGVEPLQEPRRDVENGGTESAPTGLEAAEKLAWYRVKVKAQSASPDDSDTTEAPAEGGGPTDQEVSEAI